MIKDEEIQLKYDPQSAEFRESLVRDEKRARMMNLLVQAQDIWASMYQQKMLVVSMDEKYLNAYALDDDRKYLVDATIWRGNMNKYEELMTKSDQALQKSMEYWKESDQKMAIFYRNASRTYKEQARKLTLEEVS